METHTVEQLSQPLQLRTLNLEHDLGAISILHPAVLVSTKVKHWVQLSSSTQPRSVSKFDKDFTRCWGATEDVNALLLMDSRWAKVIWISLNLSDTAGDLRYTVSVRIRTYVSRGSRIQHRSRSILNLYIAQWYSEFGSHAMKALPVLEFGYSFMFHLSLLSRRKSLYDMLERYFFSIAGLLWLLILFLMLLILSLYLAGKP